MSTRTVTVMPDLSDKEVIDKEKVAEYSDDDGNDFSDYSTHSFNESSAVKGKTELPQIRELNEIAALLRSMDNQQNQLGS